MCLTQKLPPKLVIEIFVRLPSYEDIGNTRLVSKDFYCYSSHLLVPRIVVAKRPDTLRRLRDVVYYPDLKQYVIELV